MHTHRLQSALRIFFGILCCLGARTASADELGELRKELQSLRQEVQELKGIARSQQATIERLSVPSTQPLPATGTTVVRQESPQAPAATKSTSAPFIPDIGVVVDITGSLTESPEDEEGNDRFSVREIELVLGHDIDPYSRLDSTITFSDFEDVEVEEAYVSYWDLPLESRARIGRFRPKIGKATATHRDSLDTADEPFVVQKYLGVEGLFRTGVEASGFLPLSSYTFTQQLTGGILEGGVGEDGTLLGESRRAPSLYGHLSNFYEISDISNFELGGTYLIGSNSTDEELKTSLFGVDATYTYFVTPINKFKFLSEAYFQKRNDEALDQADAMEVQQFENPWGFYSLVDYRLSERWGIGTRYDFVELVENDRENPRDYEYGLTAYLTFFQSEFARWRAEYQYAELADGSDDNRAFLQGTFAIGTHKHQLQ